MVDGAAQNALIEFLEARGYETLHRSTGYSNHIHHNPVLGRIDVVYVSGDKSRRMFAEMMARIGPGGAMIPVPRPEHIAAMKIFSIKNDPRRTLRELADIRTLLDIPGVDRAAITDYFVRYGLEGLLDRLGDG